MNVKSLVAQVKNWFDWTPVSVSVPSELYCVYRDKGRVLLGYEVRVTYLHHGERCYLFAVDEEKLGLVTRDKACANALKFYREKQKQIKEKQR